MIDKISRKAIETIDLTMVYRPGKLAVPALKNVSFSVDKGEFIAIMGPSGCGKSTLLHLLGGLIKPTSGRILIDGMDISSLTDAARTAIRRDKIGYVFQRFNLLPTLTARGNIDLAKKIHGNGNQESNGGGKIIDILGLEGKINMRPSELSGGEQQRIAIARALINQPSIILADEPTGSLDSRNAHTVLQMLQNLNKELKQTIVMITHDSEAASTASRVIEMKDGRIRNPVSKFQYESELRTSIKYS